MFAEVCLLFIAGYGMTWSPISGSQALEVVARTSVDIQGNIFSNAVLDLLSFVKLHGRQRDELDNTNVKSSEADVNKPSPRCKPGNRSYYIVYYIY